MDNGNNIIDSASILSAKVAHSRLAPKNNSFCYNVYYVALPIDKIENREVDGYLPLNRFGLHSFYERDHGKKDGTSLKLWLEQIFSSYKLPPPSHAVLLSLPRVLGYVFNPVSFWFCYNEARALYAVVCEVSNTFGETHNYLCMHQNGKPITGDEWIEAEKLFHVSPFLERRGYYHFRFKLSDAACNIRIDYFDDDDNKLLTTALGGKFEKLSKRRLLKAFFGNPYATLKVIGLIHYHALKLILKGIRYVPKPQQKANKTSRSKNR